nr:MAG TPA: hypothetical protein [Bacteriophage sp.]
MWLIQRASQTSHTFGLSSTTVCMRNSFPNLLSFHFLKTSFLRAVFHG